MANTPLIPTDLFEGPTWLLKFGAVDIPGIASAFTVVSEMDALENLQWRYLSFRYTRATPAGTQEDMAQWGLNIAQVSAGLLNTDWQAADYTTVDGNVEALWTILRTVTSNTHTLVDYQYHLRSYSSELKIGLSVPQTVTEPDGSVREIQRFAPSGPPLHTVVKNQGGSVSGTPHPYSSAMSVTLKSAVRRHWGRVYLPGLASALTPGAFGRFDVVQMQTVADAFHDFFAAIDTAGFAIVVPSSQANRKYAAGLLSVTQVQVDDIPDTVRRRRSKQALNRAVGV